MLDISIQLIERPQGNVRMNLNATGPATSDERALALAIGNAARVIMEAAGRPAEETGVVYDEATGYLTLPPVEIKPFI